MIVSNPAHHERLYFFDNLRTLMVLLVLVFHSATSYITAVDFWPIHDTTATSMGIDLFLFLGDTFMMVVLFFISGYFVLPSIEKNGTLAFLKSKFKRLGLPWLVITTTYLPWIDYIHYSRINGPTNFLRYWLACMQSIFSLKFGWLDMTHYQPIPDQYYQRYVWFLSLLLAFNVVFAIIHHIRFQSKTQQNSYADSHNTRRTVAILISICLILFAAIRLFLYPDFMGDGWYSFGNLIQFQMGKLVIYMTCFSLGINAYRESWYSQPPRFSALKWFVLCFTLFGMNMVVLQTLTNSEILPLSAKLGFVILYPLWTFSFVGLFVSWSRKVLTTTNLNVLRINSLSYDMYLVHYGFPMLVPIILLDFQVGITVKFTIVSIITIVGSLLFSLGKQKFMKNI